MTNARQKTQFGKFSSQSKYALVLQLAAENYINTSKRTCIKIKYLLRVLELR